MERHDRPALRQRCAERRGSQSLTPAVNTSPLWIGQFGGNADRLDGIIDEIRIYNRALTQADVQSDMNRPL